MNQDITVVMNQKRSRFVRAEVVVCIDTADELVFALNCNDRDLQIGEFAGGECMGEDDEALDFVRHQLLNVAVLRLVVAVSGEDEEFIAIFLIRSKNLIQHLGIVVHGETRDQDADKFGLSVRENFCHFVFFIVQFIQCIGNDLLIFRCQGIRVVEIPGNGCFGKMRVLCNIIKGYIFFRAISSSVLPFKSVA